MRVTLDTATHAQLPSVVERRADQGHGSAVARWETASEWPLAAVAALFLAAYALPILAYPLSAAWRATCAGVQYGAWALFVADYVMRLAIADNRERYFTGHLVDLAVVALPMLRPLRLLRLVTLLRVMNRQITDTLRGRVVIYTVGAFSLLVFVAALAVLDAERHAPHTNITSFGDAVWWAVTTVSTVGYGDHFPVTGAGRFVAAGLMVGGVALLGVVTASFATWLVDRVRQVDQEEQAATKRDLHAILERLDALQARLEERA